MGTGTAPSARVHPGWGPRAPRATAVLGREKARACASPRFEPLGTASEGAMFNADSGGPPTAKRAPKDEPTRGAAGRNGCVWEAMTPT